MRSVLALLIVTSVLTMPVFSGVYFEGTTRSANGSVQDKSIIYLSGDRMRVENSGKQGADAPDAIIFRQDKQVMWLIDKGEGTYSEITKEDLKKMKAKIDEGMKMMQEQMKNMPPEQRKMMEEMLAKQMPGQMMQQEKTKFKKTGSDASFKTWRCDKYAGYKGDVQSAEVLTITPSQAGFSMDDFKIMKGFADFFAPLGLDTNEFLMINSDESGSEGQFDGIPVKYVNMENGKIKDTFELDKIESRNNPGSLFELPKNLEKKDLW